MKIHQFHSFSFLLFTLFGAICFASTTSHINLDNEFQLGVTNKSDSVNMTYEESNCSITFGNESWNKVIVQVSSRGRYYNCGDAPIKETFTLLRGEEYTVTGLDDACYRAKLPGAKKYSQFTATSCMLSEDDVVYVRSVGSS